MSVAFITGITGQDGSYLAELLLEKGYEVHGMVRRTSSIERSRLALLYRDPAVYGRSLHLHYADLSDSTTLRRLIKRIQPTELYHLAGQSHVGLSFEIPESTCHEVAMCTLCLLEVCRDLDRPPRIYHASSSEVFGSPDDAVQTEQTPFRPINPYGCAKAFATNICRVYRDAHQQFVCSGIAYNHESPRRGENFVTRKISSAAARIHAGSAEVLELGNLDSKRDWGWAPEYVKAMWLALNHEKASDYIFATGALTSVREFAVAAFHSLEMDLEFAGSGASETACDRHSGRLVLRVSPRFYRPVDAVGLSGDPAKALSDLGWRATLQGADVASAMALADAQSL